MKKVIFLLFYGGIFFVNSLFSQENSNKFFNKHEKITKDPNTIYLKPRLINFSKEGFVTDFPRQKKHVYLKFKNSPNKLMIDKLKKQRISLKDYLSDGAYMVEINQDKLNFLKEMYFIGGFAEIDPADKLSEKLYKKEISSYAREGNYVKVIVAFYDDVLFNDAASQIRTVGGNVESKNFSRTHKLIIKIHIDNIAKLAEIDIVKYIEEISPPKTTDNIDAGKLSNVFWDNEGNTISGLFDQDYSENPPIPYGLAGDRVNVAVKDGGKIYSHSDFAGRLNFIDADTVQLHSTHVAGTIGAVLDINDNDDDTGGMAESVNMYSFSYNYDGSNPPETEIDFTVDYVTAITNYSASLVNNSWGHVIGWGWYHEGLNDYWKSKNADLFGNYTSDSQDFDDFIYDYYDNDAVQVKSAGNNRYKRKNKNDPTIYRDGVYYAADNDYYYCMEPLSCAKNIITVGSVGTTEADNEISVFSSFGPTDDGRLKPDVVADGFELTSTIYVNSGGQNIDSYSDNDTCGHTDDFDHVPTCKKAWKGTSMSCPVITGTCALINEAYENIYSKHPTADIVKALLCNYAYDLGKPGPDFSYGFGLVDAKACIDAIFNYDASTGGHIIKGVISETGDWLEYQFQINEDLDANESVKITLVWIDPPGNPASPNAIVNDLDLSVTDSEEYRYTSFYFKEYDDFSGTETDVDPTIPARNDGQYSNRYDTVEQVKLFDHDNDGIIPAGTYTIKVSGNRVSLLNQPFAVVSSIGFKGFTFNTLKIRGADEIWVSNQFAVLSKIPDVLLMVSELDFDNDGFNPGTFEYSYSINCGTSWSAWNSVTGVYKDEGCTELCNNPHNGIAYVKKDSVPFNAVSVADNLIKFRLTYKGQTIESPEYIVKNNNIYYVSTTTREDDNEGKGTETAPWKTIGHAISSAVATANVPAIIRVQAGTYNEDIALNNYVYLYGGYDSNWHRDVKKNLITIHGSGTTHVVVADNNVVIDGFTIEGGNHQNGGGIYSEYENVQISNCRINDCVSSRGGGICIGGGSVYLANCEVFNNNSQYGGGVYFNNCNGSVYNCIIKSNTVQNKSIDDGYGRGGGIFFSNSNLTINECYFEANRGISTYSYGGGIYSISSAGSKIINSIFRNNSLEGAGSQQWGGAIYSASSSNCYILGSLFHLNTATRGGAIFCWGLTLANCTFYENITTDSTYNGAIEASYGTHYVNNCIFWENIGKDFQGNHNEILYSCMEDSGGGTGTIHDNPQFRDTANGDFRLKVNSPCIDYGNDNATGLDLLTKDIIGNPRKFKFDHNSSHTVDMGAYEYRWKFSAIEMDNSSGDVELEWESRDNDTYYVEYTDHDLKGTPSPVLHYKLNDNDNDSQVDESVSSLHGFLFDNEGEINTEDCSNDGKINSSIHFSGNQYIDCGNIGNITSNLSILAWVYLTGDDSSNRVILGKGSNSYELKVNESDRHLQMNVTDSGDNSYEYESSYACPINQWVFVAVTVNFATHEVNFYADGELEDTVAITNTNIKSTTDSMLLGSDDGLSEPWIGYLDDIRVYNIVLGQDDIDNVYNNALGTETENPLTWTRIQQAVTGEPDTTSWIDNGSQTSPAPDQLGLKHRFYKIVSE